MNLSFELLGIYFEICWSEYQVMAFIFGILLGVLTDKKKKKRGKRKWLDLKILLNY